MKKQFVLFLLCFFSLCLKGNDFVWYDGVHPISYHVDNNSDPVVSVALDMFVDDMTLVTGRKPQSQSAAMATIRVINLKKRALGSKLVRQFNVPIDSLRRAKDAFSISISNAQLLIVGSDARGAAYGILELSRMAGVSPWIWWGDVKPFKKSELVLPDNFNTYQHPSVEYRGIFLNDEDWTLQPWAWRHFDPQKKAGTISAKTYKEIFKLLLRLRANMIWPGMHGISTAFYKVDGAKEVADSCGIVIGTSHCEPMMRNNVGEWNVGERGDFNYISNKEAVQSYWVERLKEAGKYENFYTIGMRGIHDGSMEGVHTMAEKTTALQNVIDDQRVLLAKYVNKQVDRIPQSFVPYKEVLEIYENGLRVPDDVTLVWCDDNYGYMTRLSDSIQQKRRGGAGVYYHLSYWGRPHDYMWLGSTQPGLIYNEMKQAYDHQARKLWIVNVHDMKTASYGLELFLDMAWNIKRIAPNALYTHLHHCLNRDYGKSIGDKLFPAMREFYRLCGIRKPEFMGWNQVELDKRKYPRGWSPVQDTEFSLTEFGGELDRYLQDYARISETVSEVEKEIPSELADAYFAQIIYPVRGAEAMAVKLLEAQRAHSIAAGTYNVARWTRDEALIRACAKSMGAYYTIRSMTDFYNNQLANGKWKHAMCENPRDLYVFNLPTLPMGATEEEIRKYSKSSATGDNRIVTDSCLAFNACSFDASSSKNVYGIQALGHSMNAVSLPKDEYVTYEFNTDWEGKAKLIVAVIPTQPNDKGDIRYSVSVDDGKPYVISIKEPFRSETWKLNVLRGQARNSIDLFLTKGQHKLEIKALDNHIVVDQWMIDYKDKRDFYMFPLKGYYYN